MIYFKLANKFCQVFAYNIDALPTEVTSTILDGADSTPSSAFGGLLFVGRSRYNDIVVADETVSRVHCIIVRSVGHMLGLTSMSTY